MIRPLYDAATWLAQPLLRRKLRRRGAAEPGYLMAVDERFGRYGTPRPAGAGPLVWVHAVSLGETRAAAILLHALRAALPGMRLLLTHGTATGRAEGARLLMPGDVQVWQPWDTRGAVRRFHAHFRPDLGVLMETEIWPNLLREVAAHGVPLALANARLSARSLRGAARAGWLLRPAYRALAAAYAQTEADAARLRAIGTRHVEVLGNLKFDAEPDAGQLQQAARWRAALGGRPVVMLASSREGEEAAWLDLLARPPGRDGGGVGAGGGGGSARRSDGALSDPHPNPLPQAGERVSCVRVDSETNRPPAHAQKAPAAIESGVSKPPLYLVVPRHPQRFDDVAQLAAGAGLRIARRSGWSDAPPPEALAADLWVGDSLGEMALYYGLAEVALLGGSFEPLGGQNLIEAAACGCPVVMGPHTFNFAQAAELAEAAGAARRVPDLAAGVAAAQALLADAPALAVMRRAARDFAQAHRGAAERTAAALVQLLKAP